jgi:hypothetical protein
MIPCFPRNFSAIFFKKRSGVAKEVHKPGSVPPVGYPNGGDDHSSRAAVADNLKQPNPEASGGPPSNASLFGLAPDGVYQASGVTAGTGELLPRLFTLAP